MKSRISIFAFAMLWVAMSQPPGVMAENPFETPIQVRQGICVDPTATGFDKRLQEFEQSCAKGLAKAKTCLDGLAKDLERIAKNLEQTWNTNTAASPANPANTSAAAPTTTAAAPTSIWNPPGTTNTPTVGQAFIDAFKSLGELAKAFGAWVKAVWKEFTGPSAEEAPITNTVNDLKTKYQKWQLDRAAKRTGTAFKGLATSVGNFFKKLLS